MKNPSDFVKLFSILIWLVAFEFFALFSVSQASCRTLEFRTALPGKTLTNHTIRTIQPIRDDHACELQCYLEPVCFAVNFCQKDGNEAVCELTNSVTIKQDQDVIDNQECTIYSSQSSCSSSPCPKNASCHGDFLDDPVPFKCICPAGFTGRFCETDIDECALLNTNSCSVNAHCNNTIGSYKCTCKTGYQGNGQVCQDIDECASNTHDCHIASCKNIIGGFNCIYPKSCNDVLNFIPNSTDGFYQIEAVAGELHNTYCYFSSIPGCGSGPWSMALKIDGTKNTAEYDKSFWKDKSPLYADSFTTVFDDNSEIKLPAYWSYPVTKVCLGMKYSNDLNWISVDISATSLYSLCTSTQEKLTSLGKTKWTSLISSSLQSNCNKEGFNVECGSRIRIGFQANNEDNCNSCDSFIGFGISYGPFSCGNIYGGHKRKAFGYVLLQ